MGRRAGLIFGQASFPKRLEIQLQPQVLAV